MARQGCAHFQAQPMHCVTTFGWFNTNDLFYRWSLSMNWLTCLVTGAYRKHRSSEERERMKNVRRRQFASSYSTCILVYAAGAAAFDAAFFRRGVLCFCCVVAVSRWTPGSNFSCPGVLNFRVIPSLSLPAVAPGSSSSWKV